MENSDSINQQINTPSFWNRFKNAKNFISAAPNFLLALAFIFPSSCLAKLFTGSNIPLGDLVEIEFIVIHSFIFIVMVYFWKPEEKKQQVLRLVYFWGLLGLYIMMASMVYGFWGFFIFCSLALVTYIGFVLRITEPKRIAQLLVRWGVNFVIFIFLAIVFGMPKGVDKWHNSKYIYAYGAIYFIALGIFELIGFYQAKWIAKINIEKWNLK
jgi:hypothetical protein